MRDVTGAEFIRKVKKLGAARGVPVRFDAERGKGDHGTLYFGERRAIVGDLRRELKTGTVRGMLKQLGIDPSDMK